MNNIFELKKSQREHLAAAEALLGDSNHVLTQAETEQYDKHMAMIDDISRTIAAHEKKNTLRNFFKNGQPSGALLHNDDGPASEDSIGFVGTFSMPPDSAETHSPQYKASLLNFLRTGGKAHSEELMAGADGNGGYLMPGSYLYTRQRGANGAFSGMSAALYEGAGGNSDAAGGYAINVPTVQQIVPLALPDLGIFDASMVIPTATDIKIPQQVSFGTSEIKSESTGTMAQFGGTDPTLGQITLSAYMAGAVRLPHGSCCRTFSSFSSSS